MWKLPIMLAMGERALNACSSGPGQTLHPAQHRELQALCEESQRRGTIEANLDQLKVGPPELQEEL